jgi:alpha-L-fucosidase
MKTNGEAIYGTRPWLSYGEGATRVEGGHFKEDFAFTARDIRFTTKGNALYAIALGWPTDGKITIKSLAQPAGTKFNQVKRVELLGHRGNVAFTQDATGLVVTLPGTKTSSIALSLKITGDELRPAGGSQ